MDDQLQFELDDNELLSQVKFEPDDNGLPSQVKFEPGDDKASSRAKSDICDNAGDASIYVKKLINMYIDSIDKKTKITIGRMFFEYISTVDIDKFEHNIQNNIKYYALFMIEKDDLVELIDLYNKVFKNNLFAPDYKNNDDIPLPNISYKDIEKIENQVKYKKNRSAKDIYIYSKEDIVGLRVDNKWWMGEVIYRYEDMKNGLCWYYTKIKGSNQFQWVRYPYIKPYNAKRHKYYKSYSYDTYKKQQERILYLKDENIYNLNESNDIDFIIDEDDLGDVLPKKESECVSPRDESEI